LTKAKRAELFASTVAYAAVLVAFVGGDLATPKTLARVVAQQNQANIRPEYQAS